MSGYRGFLRELSRTRAGRALWLHVSAGVRHILRRALGREPDGERLFLRHYRADGFHPPAGAERQRAAHAARCLACGLCSAACAQVGGNPPVDPQEAVLAASRLASEAVRFGLAPEPAAICQSCRACEASCPRGIPIAEIIDELHAPTPERVDTAARIE